MNTTFSREDISEMKGHLIEKAKASGGVARVIRKTVGEQKWKLVVEAIKELANEKVVEAGILNVTGQSYKLLV